MKQQESIWELLCATIFCHICISEGNKSVESHWVVIQAENLDKSNLLEIGSERIKQRGSYQS